MITERLFLSVANLNQQWSLSKVPNLYATIKTPVLTLSSCTTWKHSFRYILTATLEATILRVGPVRAKTGSFSDHILETPKTKWEGMNHRVERFANWVSALCSFWLQHRKYSKRWAINTRVNQSALKTVLSWAPQIYSFEGGLKHWMFAFLLHTSKLKVPTSA